MVTSTDAGATGAAVSPAPAGRRPARERLLAAAEELFYEEGVNTVGIDRVIERAGVAKATLYSVFGSKEELVRAYLERHNETWCQRLTSELDRRCAGASPAQRILAVFDILSERSAEPTYHGCAFVSASAEARPGSLVQQASDGARAWVTDLFAGLARQAGAADPPELARQLALLYHGAGLSARMDRDYQAAATARAAAATLLAAATASQ
jgi:AcrR family transcriptional regulator